MNDDPVNLNMVVRDRSVCEAVAWFYRPYIADGLFDNHSEEVIATYSKDVDADGIVKMIKHLHEQIMEEEDEG